MLRRDAGRASSSVHWRRQRPTAAIALAQENLIRNRSLEARAGIEPAHKGFADLSLTTWVPRLGRASRSNLMIATKSP